MSFAKRYRRKMTKRALGPGHALFVLEPDEVRLALMAGWL